jgi:hypothetical protein
MNDKIAGSRGPRRVGSLAVLAAVAVLAAACGSSTPSSSGSAAAESAAFMADLAFTQCMRGKGYPNFPDPNPGRSYNVSVAPNSSGAELQAYDSCKHLLPSGNSSTSTSGGQVTQQKLEEAVKVAQCLRSHGDPGFPDPTVVNGALHYSLGNIQSAQFQNALNACRSLVPKGVTLP